MLLKIGPFQHFWSCYRVCYSNSNNIRFDSNRWRHNHLVVVAPTHATLGLLPLKWVTQYFFDWISAKQVLAKTKNNKYWGTKLHKCMWTRIRIQVIIAFASNMSSSKLPLTLVRHEALIFNNINTCKTPNKDVFF